MMSKILLVSPGGVGEVAYSIVSAILDRDEGDVVRNVPKAILAFPDDKGGGDFGRIDQHHKQTIAPIVDLENRLTVWRDDHC